MECFLHNVLFIAVYHALESSFRIHSPSPGLNYLHPHAKHVRRIWPEMKPQVEKCIALSGLSIE
jgi:hypothetical protein